MTRICKVLETLRKLYLRLAVGPRQRRVGHSQKKQGTVVSLEVEACYHPTDRLTLSAGPGITWAKSRYMQSFFGVDAEQSAPSGLPAFDAKSGISNVRVSVGANYRFDPHWSVGARFFRGDAADSPITEKASKNITRVFVVYRF